MARTAIVALILVLSACSPGKHLVVGSKNFTEQVLLGEILAQQIERRLGGEVERKLNLGGTLLAHQALTGGSIDLYPEYTGTALTAVLKHDPSSDRASVRALVKDEYLRRWNIEWIAPFGFNNTFAMVVRNDSARRFGLNTLSDATGAPEQWRLGVGYEFIKRADGLDGLLKTYGLKVKDAPTAMDLGLLYSALRSGKVDMVAANSTDGMLSILDVKVLTDDKNYFPPYECSAVVRNDKLAEFPGLEGALKELSGKIDYTTMRRLNQEVDGDHRSVREVAADFLRELK